MEGAAVIMQNRPWKTWSLIPFCFMSIQIDMKGEEGRPISAWMGISQANAHYEYVTPFFLAKKIIV